jgi:putative transcriptional regulator
MSNKLKEYMKKKNMSSTELAYKSGVGARYIGFMLQGVRTPSLKVALKMARALGCKVEDIFLSNECTKRT